MSEKTKKTATEEKKIEAVAPAAEPSAAPTKVEEQEELSPMEAAAKALETASEAPAEAVILTSVNIPENEKDEEAAPDVAEGKESDAVPSKRAAARARREETQRRAEQRRRAEAQSAERLARITLLGALHTAINQHTRYNAKVYTCFERDGVVYAAALIPGDVTVLIPFEQMFRENPLDMSTVNENSESGKRVLATRKLQVLRRMNEAEIPVVIRFADAIRNEETGETEMRVIGSRVDALEAIEKINFPVHANRRSIQEGDIVEGVVVSVATHAMRVNVGGVDVKIPKFSATNAYIPDMNEVYHANDKIALYIAEIKHREDGTVDLRVDGRVAERVKNRDRLKMIPQGSEVVGTITSTRRDYTNKEFTIMYAYVDSVGVPCVVKSVAANVLGRDIKIGDRVRMIVTGYTDTGYLRTIVREFLGSSKFDGR